MQLYYIIIIYAYYIIIYNDYATQTIFNSYVSRQSVKTESKLLF